jgi:hypothetical protein
LFGNSLIDRTQILSYLGDGGELMVIHEEVIEREAEINHPDAELVSIYQN